MGADVRVVLEIPWLLCVFGPEPAGRKPVPHRLGLRAAKRDRNTVWRQAIPSLAMWLSALRKHYTNHPVPQPSALNASLHWLFHHLHYMWHALRRGGAAALVQLAPLHPKTARPLVPLGPALL